MLLSRNSLPDNSEVLGFFLNFGKYRNLLFYGALPLQDQIAGTLEQPLPHLCEPGTVASPNRSAGSNSHYLANILMGGDICSGGFPTEDACVP